jgi:hypothetical protein
MAREAESDCRNRVGAQSDLAASLEPPAGGARAWGNPRVTRR